MGVANYLLDTICPSSRSCFVVVSINLLPLELQELPSCVERKVVGLNGADELVQPLLQTPRHVLGRDVRFVIKFNDVVVISSLV